MGKILCKSLSKIITFKGVCLFKKQITEFLICLLLIIILSFVWISTVFGGLYESSVEVGSPDTDLVDFSEISVEVSSLGTFLCADLSPKEGDYVVDEPRIINLEKVKLNNSRWILISYSGEFFYSSEQKYSDYEITLIGLFSTSSELKSIDNLNRVPGAIDAGIDYKTGKTLLHDLPTDIPEDFIIRSPFESRIEIPSEAKFLFLCIADIYYPDNSGSIQVTIAELENYQLLFSLENFVVILEVAYIVFLLIYYRRELKSSNKKYVYIKS